MYFVVNKEIGLDLDIIEQIVVNALDCTFYDHSYIYATMKEVGDASYKNYIPIGSKQFVESWLKGIGMNITLDTIEVPSSLRIEKFLKRYYEFIKGSELPKKGNYFVKNVTNPKEVTFTGDISNIGNNFKLGGIFNINPNEIYVISEVVNILSEYRVFVKGNEVLAVQPYDGNPLVFPNPNIILDMVNSYNEKRPNSYTLDVAVIHKNNEYHTVVLEVHPMSFVGLYGFEDKVLPEMYADGINWYIRDYFKIDDNKIPKLTMRKSR